MRVRRGRATVIQPNPVVAGCDSQTFVRVSDTAAGRVIPGDLSMANAALGTPARPIPIPVGEIAPWAVFAGLVMFVLLYLVGVEQGATAIFSGMYVHEFVHDGRHLLGFPFH